MAVKRRFFNNLAQTSPSLRPSLTFSVRSELALTFTMRNIVPGRFGEAVVQSESSLMRYPPSSEALTQATQILLNSVEEKLKADKS